MITLRPLTESDRGWFETTFVAYFTEIAPDLELETDETWWQEVSGNTFAIQFDGDVGFAMLRQTDEGIWEISEFYVLPPARRGGIGRAAVHQLLMSHPGPWQLGAVKLGPAQEFWARILPNVPGLCDLTTHPPLFPSQAVRYRFTMTEANDA